MKVVLLPQAAEDLDQILEPLYGRVRKHLAVLGEFPELGSRMHGIYADYRSTVMEFYRVVYRLRPDGIVEIAFVRDCRRRRPRRPRRNAGIAGLP
jgi:plasmid stabilization system protein ParE